VTKVPSRRLSDSQPWRSLKIRLSAPANRAEAARSSAPCSPGGMTETGSGLVPPSAGIASRRLSGPYGDQADPRQSFRPHLQRSQSLARRPARAPLRIYFNPQARLLAQSHRGVPFQTRPLGPAPSASHASRSSRIASCCRGLFQQRSRHSHLDLQARQGRMI
jgi:hypothetical protein